MRGFVALILLLRFLFTNQIGIAIIVLFLIAMSSESDVVMNITSSIVAFIIIVAIIVGIINFLDNSKMNFFKFKSF